MKKRESQRPKPDSEPRTHDLELVVGPDGDDGLSSDEAQAAFEGYVVDQTPVSADELLEIQSFVDERRKALDQEKPDKTTFYDFIRSLGEAARSGGLSAHAELLALSTRLRFEENRDVEDTTQRQRRYNRRIRALLDEEISTLPPLKRSRGRKPLGTLQVFEICSWMEYLHQKHRRQDECIVAANRAMKRGRARRFSSRSKTDSEGHPWCLGHTLKDAAQIVRLILRKESSTARLYLQAATILDYYETLSRRLGQHIVSTASSDLVHARSGFFVRAATPSEKRVLWRAASR